MFSSLIKIILSLVPAMAICVAIHETITSETLVSIMKYSWYLLIGIVFFILYSVAFLFAAYYALKSLKVFYSSRYKAWLLKQTKKDSSAGN